MTNMNGNTQSNAVLNIDQKATFTQMMQEIQYADKI